jgi:hypothetical protein
MRHKPLPRLLITLLGLVFIFWGLSGVMLGFFGEETSAVITHIRREGGERNETIPNRYTYNISYRFTLPDGKAIDGFTKRVGNAVYLKVDGTSTVRVRYFPALPYINALKRDTGLGVGQMVLIVVGGFLIYAVNSRQKSHD